MVGPDLTGQPVGHQSQQGRLILVVEDDVDLNDMMGTVLEAARFRVARARNGLEGLAEIDRELPDLILLDMKMPVMDGWEFAARLKAARSGNIPIVVVTAAADPRARAVEIGAQGYLSKPFDLEELLRCANGHYSPVQPRHRD